MIMIVRGHQAGYLIVYVIVSVFALMSIGLAILSLVGTTQVFTQDDVYRKNAANMARACVSVVINELNEDAEFSGFSPSAKTLYDRTSSGGTRSTCVINTIQDAADGGKTVHLTAYEYRHANDPNPVSYRAQALVGGGAGEIIDHWRNGMLIGHGGMELSGWGAINSPRVNVLGRLTLNNLWLSSTNTINAPSNIFNIGCGMANWPEHCSGQNPIVIQGNGQLSGNVCAPGQLSSAGIYSLNPGCTLPPETMPPFDKAGFIDGLSGPTIAASTITSNGGCYTEPFPGFGMYNGATYTVPAGAIITGTIDLTALPSSMSGTCEVVFNGDAYITGGVITSTSYSGTTIFRVSNNVSDNIKIIMNGQMYIQNPGVFSFVASSSGKLAHILNFHSSNASCSSSSTIPSATVSSCLTPVEAMTSATNVAYASLKLDDNSSTTNLSGTTFYAYYGKVDFGCNPGTIAVAAIAAQGLRVCNFNSNMNLEVYKDVTFGVPFSSGGGSGYQVVDFFQR